MHINIKLEDEDNILFFYPYLHLSIKDLIILIIFIKNIIKLNNLIYFFFKSKNII